MDNQTQLNMSTQKTEWDKLQVTMPKPMKELIHRLTKTAGTNGANWARNLIVDALPELSAKAEAREAALLALAGENLPAIPPKKTVAHSWNAARRKERKTAKAGRR